MMNLSVPLSVGVVTTLLQFTEATPFVFCCSVKPVEGDGHETIAVFVAVTVMASNGAPGDCTTDSKLQKPPVTEKFPPLIAPASGWSRVRDAAHGIPAARARAAAAVNGEPVNGVRLGESRKADRRSHKPEGYELPPGFA